MNPDTKREIDVAQHEVAGIVRETQDLTIKTSDDMAKATGMLGKIKNFQKAIKAKKQAILGPMKVAMDEVRSQFAEAEERAASAETTLKNAMLEYQQKQERKAAKKTAKIEERVDSGELDLSEGVAKLGKVNTPDQSVKTEAGQVSFKTVRKIRITAFSELPTSYYMRERVLAAIEMEVRNDVLKLNKPCPPGAEIYEDRQVAARG